MHLAKDPRFQGESCYSNMAGPQRIPQFYARRSRLVCRQPGHYGIYGKLLALTPPAGGVNENPILQAEHYPPVALGNILRASVRLGYFCMPYGFHSSGRMLIVCASLAVPSFAQTSAPPLPSSQPPASSSAVAMPPLLFEVAAIRQDKSGSGSLIRTPTTAALPQPTSP